MSRKTINFAPFCYKKPKLVIRMKKNLFLGLLSIAAASAFAQTDKQLYDFVVPRDGSLADAIQAANNRQDINTRYRIFIMPGEYRLPADSTNMVLGGDSVKYPTPITYLRTGNTSIIGEDFNTTSFTNTTPQVEWHNPWGVANPLEGISKSDVLYICKGADNCYMQGITIKSSIADAHGRNIALNDNSNKTIIKDCCLWGFQDTYVSHAQQRYYFEGGVIRGCVDYCCGKGDVWYNQVTLRTAGGGFLAVPSRPFKYGYVFDRCRIVSDGNNGDNSYTLGRPWGKGTPSAVFLNTTMEIKPSQIGWDEMSGGWPTRFAEFNSMDADKKPISLSGRKTTFGDKKNCNKPVLTEEEAAKYTIELVMGADDGWEPRDFTRQVEPVKKLKAKKGILTWKHCDDALLYAILRNGSVVDFTTENTYTLPTDTQKSDKWSIRCANQMGGLGEASNQVSSK